MEKCKCRLSTPLMCLLLPRVLVSGPRHLRRRSILSPLDPLIIWVNQLTECTNICEFLKLTDYTATSYIVSDHKSRVQLVVNFVKLERRRSHCAIALATRATS